MGYAMSGRVVITGIGAVTPLGNTARELHEGWLAGRVGIEGGLGACTDFDPTEFMTTKEARRSDRFTQLAVAAGAQAVADAGWDGEEPPVDPSDIGCVIGSGIGGMATFEAQCGVLRDRGPERVSPLAIPLIMGNAAAGVVAMRHGLRGPVFGVMSACASGTHAIGEAARMIRCGEAMAVVAGGAEATLTPLAKAAFGAMEATSPTGISRPFDARRDGFVMGEGAGVLVLEELEHAQRRGAKIYAEVIGYGLSGDAYHITSPSPDGDGGFRSMSAALKRAGLTASDLDYINAHGTSTPLGDEIELGAVERLLGNAASKVAMSSTKSSTGHLLGAAGAIEAIFAILAIRDNVVPPTINLDNPSVETAIDLVPHQSKKREVNVALSNSFGFGGTNASVIFRRLVH